jgi:SAM-dependent methyltransferase
MDEQTIEAYEQLAEAIFSRHTRFDRTTHHERMLPWLRPAEPTADVGSGSGADLAWLVSQGFPAVGYEPVAGLRQLAIATFPGIDVRASSLPDLEGVPVGAFGNVICSAVLMHLPVSSISPAIASLSRILRPGGRLLLSYRPGKDGAEREDDGRLFTPIAPDLINRFLSESELRVVHQSATADPNRPGVIFERFVAEKLQQIPDV